MVETICDECAGCNACQPFAIPVLIATDGFTGCMTRGDAERLIESSSIPVKEWRVTCAVTGQPMRVDLDCTAHVYIRSLY